MASTRLLNKLSRKMPPPPEAAAILETLATQNDHIAALVGASVLETILEAMITARFASKDTALQNNIFQNRGPLSDFNSKILVAEALGIVSDNTAVELHLIRAIRNVFAHARAPVTFENEEISEFVKQSPLIGAAFGALKGSTLTDVFERIPAKNRFCLLCHLLALILDAMHRRQDGTGLIGKAAEETAKAADAAFAATLEQAAETIGDETTDKDAPT